METLFQSAAGRVQGSSPAPAAGSLPPVVRDGRVTIAELIDAYAAAYAGRDKSRMSRLAYWHAKLGATTLLELSDDDVFHAIEELATQRGRHYVGRDADDRSIFKHKAKAYRPATLNRFLACLSAVCMWAIRQRIAPKGWENPCKRVQMRAEKNEIVRFLSDDERERLLTACKASKWPKLYALVTLAIVTGARKGELMGLRWGDVDLTAGLAHVEVTKNGDRKTLALTPAVVAELQRFKAADSALVFASSRRPDKAFHVAATAWPAALKAAKITRFRFHDLRHTCASYLAQNGATLLEIADVLGHRNLSVTKRYSHLAVGHKQALINRVLGGVG